MNLSIIVPAHNEETAIASTLHGLLQQVKTPCEILVVADHCTDRTEQIVADIARSHPTVRLLRNTERKGSFSNAIITGFRKAQGDAVVPFMADACDDPATIDRIKAKMHEGYDVVCGSRYMRGGRKIGGPVLQNLFSRLVSYSLKCVTGIPTWDAANAFKMYRRPFLETIDYDIPDIGTEYSMALLFRAYRAGAKITEIPTIWTWRETPLPLSQEWKIFKRLPAYWKGVRDSLRS